MAFNIQLEFSSGRKRFAIKTMAPLERAGKNLSILVLGFFFSKTQHTVMSELNRAPFTRKRHRARSVARFCWTLPYVIQQAMRRRDSVRSAASVSLPASREPRKEVCTVKDGDTTTTTESVPSPPRRRVLYANASATMLRPEQPKTLTRAPFSSRARHLVFHCRT